MWWQEMTAPRLKSDPGRWAPKGAGYQHKCWRVWIQLQQQSLRLQGPLEKNAQFGLKFNASCISLRTHITYGVSYVMTHQHCLHQIDEGNGCSLCKTPSTAQTSRLAYGKAFQQFSGAGVLFLNEQVSWARDILLNSRIQSSCERAEWAWTASPCKLAVWETRDESSQPPEQMQKAVEVKRKKVRAHRLANR